MTIRALKDWTLSGLNMMGLLCCFSQIGTAAPVFQNHGIGSSQVTPTEQALPPDRTIFPPEMWRLGSNDDQDSVFGLIGDAIVDKQGNTYLLDTALSTIYKVDSTGSILSSLGREGDGPGEFRHTRSLAFMPNGDIGILELMPDRIIVLGRHGQPKPGFVLAGESKDRMNSIRRMAAWERGVVVGQVITEFGTEKTSATYSLSCYASDGTLRNILLQDTDEQSAGTATVTIGTNKNDFTKNWALCPNGKIVLFRNDQEYELEIFDSTGNPSKTIRRDHHPVRRLDRDIERDRRRQETFRKQFGDLAQRPVAEFDRPISRVFPRPNGDIWVKNAQGDRDCLEVGLGYFDVFNQQGQFCSRVCIEADYDPERDNFRIVGNFLLVFKEAQEAPEKTRSSGGGGMLLVVMGGGTDEPEEDDEPRPYEVICYHLP